MKVMRGSIDIEAEGAGAIGALRELQWNPTSLAAARRFTKVWLSAAEGRSTEHITVREVSEAKD